MRNRARMQPWVPLDVRRRTRAYCVTRDLTESALTAAALVQYMDASGVDEKLVVRRLDGLTQAVAHLQHDLDVLGVAFGGYRRVRPAQPVSTGSSMARTAERGGAAVPCFSVSAGICRGPTGCAIFPIPTASKPA